MLKTQVTKECVACRRATESNLTRRFTRTQMENSSPDTKKAWMLRHPRYCFKHIPSSLIGSYGWVVNSKGGPAATEGRKLMMKRDYIDYMDKLCVLTPGEKIIVRATPKGERANIAQRPNLKWVSIVPSTIMQCAQDTLPCAGKEVCYTFNNRGYHCSKHGDNSTIRSKEIS